MAWWGVGVGAKNHLHAENGGYSKRELNDNMVDMDKICGAK